MADELPTSGANTEAPPRVKRAYKKRRKRRIARSPAATPNTTVRPPVPRLDPLEAAQEAQRHAQEGNLKLARAVDVLRTSLETIIQADWDHVANRACSAGDLRQIALRAMDEYSSISGQSWRKHKLIGSRAGDRDLSTLEE